MPKLSIVVVVRAQARRLGRVVALANGAAAGTVELLLVDDATSDGSAAVLDAWQRRRPGLVRCLRRGPGAASHPAFDDGLAAATGEWVIFPEASRALPTGRLQRLRDFLCRPDDPSLALVCLDAPAPGRTPAAPARDAEALRLPIGLLPSAPEASHACFRRAPLLASRTPLDGRARPDFVGTAVLLRYLLAAADKSVAWLPGGAARVPEPPPASAWAAASTYGEAVVNGPLALLDAARRAGARAPAWLQRAVLHELHWYYAADLRPKSPTAMVSEAMAAVFHDLVQQVLDGIDEEIVESLDPARVGVEVREALRSYKRPHATPGVAVAGHDAEQGLLRLGFHLHGRRPVERFLLDGAPVAPAHAKYRSCRFFRRTLCHERIVWLPAGDARMLEMRLDGAPAALSIGQRGAAAPAESSRPAARLSLGAVRAAFGPTPVARSAASLKAGALRWLAGRGFVRRRFAHAWVFIDREAEADDNAEHQYRWTRRHHPDINAWFLLDRASPDWDRLEREGFRLMPPGLARRLLMLNSEHLLSSQPAHGSAGFDRALHGGALPWRFTFLQHGVIMNDLSHWLNGQPFDVFVTSSPAEERAIAGDDTPYIHTGREVRRTGLSRHDRLLELSRQLSPAQVDTVLLMPTWRGRLSEAGGGEDARRAAFGDSHYARSWRALLASDALQRVAERHGKRLVFMPHPDSAPFVEAFEAPAHVEVTTKAATPIQPLFCRSAAMVTDYSSVAFEMAFLRRPVVYYQFDRDRFFAGDHNWREGYFSFERDGFGPVVMEPGEVARRLDLLLAPGAPALDEYLARMERALPDRDGRACRRVHEAVLGIRRRHPAHGGAAMPPDTPAAAGHEVAARTLPGSEADMQHTPTPLQARR